MSFEIFKKFENNDYGEGVLLQEYNGEYSLILANEGQDGVVWKKWGYPQGKDRAPIAKSLPWKVKLGDNKDDALAMLSFMYHQLKGD